MGGAPSQLDDLRDKTEAGIEAQDQKYQSIVAVERPVSQIA
jgi:hypothetical protein